MEMKMKINLAIHKLVRYFSFQYRIVNQNSLEEGKVADKQTTALGLSD